MNSDRRTAVVAGVFFIIAAVAALPVFAWEMSLAVWLIVKGFRPFPITSHG